MEVHLALCGVGHKVGHNVSKLEIVSRHFFLLLMANYANSQEKVNVFLLSFIYITADFGTRVSYSSHRHRKMPKQRQRKIDIFKLHIR